MVVPHGPLRDSADCDITPYWKHVEELVAKHSADMPIVLLCDANARCSAEVEGCVGPDISRKANEATVAFGEFLHRLHLLVTRFL